jgi:protein O-GlcNAc transferase
LVRATPVERSVSPEGPLEAAARYLAAARDARTHPTALAELKLLIDGAKERATLSELGSVLRRHGFAGLAVAAAERAIALEPRRVESYLTLSAALTDQGQAEAAVRACRGAIELDSQCWPAYSNLLFALHFQPQLTRQQVFEEHRAFGARLTACVRPERLPAPARLEPGRRLRLGYVSPDFCAHAVAHFLEPVLAEHERSAFEVHCYSDTLRPDATTERLARLVDHFVPSGRLSHPQLSERIAKDQIDVLVDLAGHTARNRLPVFARSPSPVQVSWLGYFDTTGLPAIQYRIADEQLVPAGAERHFVERIVRLPRSANCFRPPPGPAPAPPPVLGRGQVTFGCFSNPAKIGRQVVAAFARILHAVPASRWIGKYRGLDDPDAQARLAGWFASEGIPSERIEFRGASAMPEFLATFSEIDIALDPFPYGGETTALHTLWMGVPLVSLEGQAPAQRLSSRVLRHAALEACIADTPDRYVQIATALAFNHARLVDLRRVLRARLQASPLLDARLVTRDLEAAYRQMWRDHCSESARELRPALASEY